MKGKKTVIMLLILAFCTGLLGGCGRSVENTGEERQFHIVCTTFPQYDWVKEVLGEQNAKCKVTLLLDGGTDLHNYQPTVEDMAEISTCDVFIYVGGESDRWVEDALENPVNPNRRVLNMMELLSDSIKEEEPTAEETHEHSETEYDEHVWLSLKNARVVVEEIARILSEMQEEAAEGYQKNADDYLAELDALDSAYETAVQAAEKHTLLFGDRFPFRYLTEDYGLEYFAAFAGCSAETEASFETITFLADKADELQLNAVLIIENSDGKVAEAIVRNTKSRKQQILQMNSLQSVSAADIEAGETYLSVMEENLEVLKKALE